VADIGENIKLTKLTDNEKALLAEEAGLNLDSDLFDPRFDYVFKRIFTADDKRSKAALINFLNSVLRFEGDGIINDLIVISSEIPVDYREYKKAIFDVRVTIKNGEQAIVEMQVERNDDFRKRSQFIISKAYSTQEISGYAYSNLKKCYLVCVTNFTLFDNADNFSDYMFRNRKGEPLNDDMTIVFLELSKIEQLLSKSVDKLTDDECWAIFLRYASYKDKRDVLKKILIRKEGIQMAAQILESISKDKRERVAYEEALLAEMDAVSRQIYAEQQGIQRGIQQGTAKSDAKWTAVVAEKDAALANKDAALANRDAEIAKLQAELARLHNLHEPTA